MMLYNETTIAQLPSFEGYEVHVTDRGRFVTWPEGSNAQAKDDLALVGSELEELKARVHERNTAAARQSVTKVEVPCKVVITRGKAYEALAANFCGYHGNTGKPIFKTVQGAKIEGIKHVFREEKSNQELKELVEALTRISDLESEVFRLKGGGRFGARRDETEEQRFAREVSLGYGRTGRMTPERRQEANQDVVEKLTK